MRMSCGRIPFAEHEDVRAPEHRRKSDVEDLVLRARHGIARFGDHAVDRIGAIAPCGVEAAKDPMLVAARKLQDDIAAVTDIEVIGIVVRTAGECVVALPADETLAPVSASNTSSPSKPYIASACPPPSKTSPSEVPC